MLHFCCQDYHAHKTCQKSQVIPPGMEFRNIAPQDGDADGEIDGNDSSGAADPTIWSEV